MKNDFYGQPTILLQCKMVIWYLSTSTMSSSYCGYGFFVSDSTIPSTSRAFISNSWHSNLSISSFSHPHRLHLPPFRPPHIKKPHIKASRTRTSFSALPFDLSPPPIDEDLLVSLFLYVVQWFVVILTKFIAELLYADLTLE